MAIARAARATSRPAPIPAPRLSPAALDDQRRAQAGHDHGDGHRDIERDADGDIEQVDAQEPNLVAAETQREAGLHLALRQETQPGRLEHQRRSDPQRDCQHDEEERGAQHGEDMPHRHLLGELTALFQNDELDQAGPDGRQDQQRAGDEQAADENLRQGDADRPARILAEALEEIEDGCADIECARAHDGPLRPLSLKAAMMPHAGQ